MKWIRRSKTIKEPPRDKDLHLDLPQAAPTFDSSLMAETHYAKDSRERIAHQKPEIGKSRHIKRPQLVVQSSAPYVSQVAYRLNEVEPEEMPTQEMATRFPTFDPKPEQKIHILHKIKTRALSLYGALFLSSTIAICFAAIFIFHLAMSGTMGWNLIEVPKLTGKPFEKIRGLSSTQEFSIVQMGQVYHKRIADGSVARQIPSPGTRVPRGTKIAVSISKGRREIIMPALEGFSFAEAMFVLKQIGIKIGKTSYAVKPQMVEGTVVATEPKSGMQVTHNLPVNIVIAMPTAQKRREKSSRHEKTILSSSKKRKKAAARAKAKQDSKAKRSSLIKVPKVTGIRFKFAKRYLEARGLSVGRISTKNDEDHMDTFVFRQTPVPGTKVQHGAAVDLLINDTD